MPGSSFHSGQGCVSGEQCAVSLSQCTRVHIIVDVNLWQFTPEIIGFVTGHTVNYLRLTRLPLYIICPLLKLAQSSSQPAKIKPFKLPPGRSWQYGCRLSTTTHVLEVLVRTWCEINKLRDCWTKTADLTGDEEKNSGCTFLELRPLQGKNSRKQTKQEDFSLSVR